MKKFLVLCLSALFLFALTPFALAQETCKHVEKSVHLEFSSTIEEDNAEIVTNKLKNTVIEYLEKNWSEHYSLSNFNVVFTGFKFNGSSFSAFGYIEFDTLLKYNSIEDLPFVKATKDVLKISSMENIAQGNFIELFSSQKSIADLAKQAIIPNETMSKIFTENELAQYEVVVEALAEFDSKQVKYLGFVLKDFYSEVNSYIGTPTGNSIFFKFSGNLPVDGSKNKLSSAHQIKNLNMAFENADNGYFEPANLTPGNSSQLYRDGFISISNFIEKTKAKDLSTFDINNKEAENYSGYDRLAAAAWAGAYVSNPVSDCYCYSLGYPDYGGVNYSKWANTVYPYQETFCHSDCANFVSQCMREGGLPTSVGEWYRVRYSPTDLGTLAWRNIPDLKRFMNDNDYWEESDFINCNAGNPFLTSSSHIVINTKNDTITRTYNGHTNDRKNASYSTRSWDFYIINTN